MRSIDTLNLTIPVVISYRPCRGWESAVLTIPCGTALVVDCGVN